jgi:ankyrin repeat protein
LEIVKILVQSGADKDSMDKFGCTPLHIAIEMCQLEMVKFLVESGADLDSIINVNQIPLQLAAASNLHSSPGSMDGLLDSTSTNTIKVKT